MTEMKHGQSPERYTFSSTAPIGCRSSWPLKAAHSNLFVPRTSTSTYIPRSFIDSVPVSWNSLPTLLHAAILI